MSRHHQQHRHRKAKGGKPTGLFGIYVDLLAKQVPIERRRLLLDSNAPLTHFMANENEVLRKLAESMTYGVYGPCPLCNSWNLKHNFKKRGFTCNGEKDVSTKCTYSSTDPPKKPFTVPTDFGDIQFLKEYNFDDRGKILETVPAGRDGGDRRDGYKQKNEDGTSGYAMTEKTNDMFEMYYKNQGIVPESEWDMFMEALRSPLPCTFRVTGYKSQARELLKVIKSDYFNELMDVVIDDKKVDPPKCLTWYPDGLAWQLNLERKIIRHNGVLSRLKQFLLTETESGHISRQEAVSMIPPLVLDVQPHHKVLDLCAAPGSKTAQLIEALHADESIAVPDGYVVANDSDNKRCYLMVHQVKRLESPCFTIINHDASQLPGFKEQTAEGLKLIKFDRVLADVPCSGDGTLRKNVDAWQKWNTGAGHNLHILQSRILKRGLDILAVGGRLVYSTCTFNPIEDEAVLANVISNYEGTAEIIDVSSELPGLKYTRGLSSWKVMSRIGQWFDKMEDVPEKLTTQIHPSMFPPTPEIAQTLHLDRCVRVLPHHQDTGGFFVAAIVKTEDFKMKEKRLKEQEQEVATQAENMEEAKEQQGEVDSQTVKSDSVENGNKEGTRDKRRPDDPDNPPPLKKQKFRGFKEDPFIFLTQDVDIWPKIKEFYGVTDDYPIDQLMVRCETGQKRNVYFVSPHIKQLVLCNEEKIRFINHGLRVLNRSPSKYCTCDYRLVQEGVEHFYPYTSKRIVKATQPDLVTLLTGEAPFIHQLSLNLQTQLNDVEQGSIVYTYDPKDQDDPESAQPQCKMTVTGWKGMTSARTFLPKHDRAHYLRLCGHEFTGDLKPMERTKAKKTTDAPNSDCAEISQDSDVPEQTENALQPKAQEKIVNSTQFDRQEQSEKAASGDGCNASDMCTEISSDKMEEDLTGSVHTKGDEKETESNS